MSDGGLPAGYAAFSVRGARVVALAAAAGAVREAVAAGSLFEWAAARPGARAFEGRGPAWATRLGEGDDVVVRHSRHGGAFAALTRDLFLVPTRAPRELAAALRLQAAGVPTPEVVAYAVYPAFGPLARADVATRLVEGADLPAAWREARDDRERAALLRAVGTLLEALRVAGAVHADLNLKNVFIARRGDRHTAYVLDVDRISFGEAGSLELAGRNFGRLARSARKWRAQWGLAFGEEDLARIAEAAGWSPTR